MMLVHASRSHENQFFDNRLQPPLFRNLSRVTTPRPRIHENSLHSPLL